MTRVDPRRLLLGLAAPALALLAALVVSAAALRLNGNEPFGLFGQMLDFGTTPRSLVSTVNGAVPYFLAGLAVAVAFRMALFNIGVEGQYRLAALVAAWAGAQLRLPAPLHVAAIVLVAMVVGSLWAGIAGVLRATRGVSEVISTIMLNSIATALAAYLFATHLSDPATRTGNPATGELARSARVPTLDAALHALGISTVRGSPVTGFVVVAVLVGIAVSVLLGRTRFGFELRATGINPFAAAAGGVEAKAMVVKTMLLSGALAGLVGLPQVLGTAGRYSGAFTTGIGFTGVAVALLGRNRPLGIALGALLFAFLDRSTQTLQGSGVPPQIAVIMQGSIVLSVVIAYEVVRRVAERQAGRAVRQGASPPAAPAPPPASAVQVPA